jgi:chromosome segregation ATPase
MNNLWLLQFKIRIPIATGTKFKIVTMSIGEDQLKRIQDKLQQLLKQHDILQKENKWLKTELSNSKKQTSQQNDNIDQLKQQVEVLKLNAGEMSDPDKKQFEKRINVYLKEIDRCIAMLGN